MDPLVIGLLAVTAFLAGIVDAIAGGGGLITLPALLAAGLPPQLALGTNKGQSVWGSCASAIAFWRAKRIDTKWALFTFPLAFAGSVVGASLVLLISKDALRPLVIAMLIGAAVLLFIKKPTRDEDAPRPGAIWYAVGLAVVIGCYDGFFGPGTGTFLIVGFVALCGKSLVRATADAKVVNLGSNVAALVAFASHGSVVWKISIPMAIGQILGGVLGARMAIKGGAKLIRAMVVVVSGALVVKLVWDLV